MSSRLVLILLCRITEFCFAEPALGMTRFINSKQGGLPPRSQNLNWKKLIIKKRLETILRVKHWMAKGGDKNV